MRNEVRKPTVDEWFLALQLKSIKKGFHLPLYLEADITRLVEKLDSRDKTPYTAILIKAASHLIYQMPEVNKATVHSICGVKIIEPTYNSVNLPLELLIDGKKVLTGITIRDAYKRSLKEINEEIKLAKNKTLNDLPVNRIVHGSGFDWVKKFKLRIIHFMMNNFPRLYLKKGGGGISVSSLMNLASPEVNVHMSAYGMTMITISSCSVEKREGRELLKVGFAFDHLVVHGAQGVKASVELVKILQNPALF
ncbi:hypothetical protein [Peredibacter starrii]|uniref:2-oxoacid dehydrogenase acyltransferase catalytic domain-containing protein n=1 Tax=Peredibacter starrii TaxID=28202 RepID=A0AAX4HQG1_9BACT|nr:hypothetical protein [Peredibacter starrii]WPU65435.1 hypothetical protein SOO65_01605 [Peredibacter starrii]